MKKSIFWYADESLTYKMTFTFRHNNMQIRVQGSQRAVKETEDAVYLLECVSGAILSTATYTSFRSPVISNVHLILAFWLIFNRHKSDMFFVRVLYPSLQTTKLVWRESNEEARNHVAFILF